MIHGKASSYKNGCRCGECREAFRHDMREYMHRTGRAKPLDVHLAEVRANPPAHGTECRYTAPHNCRCEECKRASAAARRDRRWADPDATRAYYRAYYHRKRQASA